MGLISSNSLISPLPWTFSITPGVDFACSGLLLGVQALEEKLDAPGISRQQQSVLILGRNGVRCRMVLTAKEEYEE